MDITVLIEFIKTNPLCYFVGGIAVGYYLRVYLTDYRIKRPSRYQSKKFGSSVKRSNSVDDLNLSEPSFGWSDVTEKAIKPQTLSKIALDQSRNSLQLD